MSPKSAGVFSRLQKTGPAAKVASPRASIAGPHVHARVCGPITTAITKAMTRKIDETTGMIG
jgi:hypothetical protein